jgi:tetratricopeptide (TPR) repeat protein
MSVALELSNPIPAPRSLRREQLSSPQKLDEYIKLLESACMQEPQSADLRTCLGMAHAMNLDVYKSMASLEHAIELDSNHFFARFRYAELFFRLRALPRAELEARRAVRLATNAWQFAMARRQLGEIQKLIETQPRDRSSDFLVQPTLGVLLLLCLACIVALWPR